MKIILGLAALLLSFSSYAITFVNNTSDNFGTPTYPIEIKGVKGGHTVKLYFFDHDSEWSGSNNIPHLSATLEAPHHEQYTIYLKDWSALNDMIVPSGKIWCEIIANHSSGRTVLSDQCS